MNGVEATKHLCERTITKPLILTTFDDNSYIIDAIKYGAQGYLLKNNDPEKIRDAIKTVHNGHYVLQDTVLDKLKLGITIDKDSSKLSNDIKIDRSQFTDRELDIMAYIAKGLTNKEISQKLFISEGTIANHITSILGRRALLTVRRLRYIT